MRIFAISDVHADYAENMALIQALSGQGHARDTLLLAGDVTDDLAKLARVLGEVREKFAQVFFVPGNHELWLRRGQPGDSVAKFERILRLCDGPRGGHDSSPGGRRPRRPRSLGGALVIVVREAGAGCRQPVRSQGRRRPEPLHVGR